MPSLNLSNLFRRSTAAMSLRERSASLRAAVSPQAGKPSTLPAPGSEEAKAAFAAACREHSVRTNPPEGWPSLARDGGRIWTRHDLGKAMDTGEITPAEYARLYPLASERELQIETVGHELNLGSLFALAYANEYPLPTGVIGEDIGGGDAELLALRKDWEAAAAAFAQTIRDQETISDMAATIETPPPREPHEEWAKLIPGWRERTGVEAAEATSAAAMDHLCEIENRIAAMPATTLAGLRLKARVAQRNDDVAWPDELGTGLVRAILAIGEPEVEVDADLIRLGQQFEAARAREMAACEACNAAQREADRHMPERPACLVYRASDADLMVHQNLMMAEALAGREVRSSDIEWLRRKMPMQHEVLRPIREGERAHIDHPGRKFDIVPHPEAQARAEEIVTAWESWCAAKATISMQYITPELDAAANEAGDAAATLAERIAALPARTAEGFRVKLRALESYNPRAFPSEIPSEPDQDQLLAHSLWRDVQSGAQPAAEPVDWHNPPPGFMAYPAIEPQGFLIIREGLRLELDRLHRIALAEFHRKAKGLRERMSENEARERVAAIRAELFLSPLTAAVGPGGDGAAALAGIGVPAKQPEKVQAHVTSLLDQADVADATLEDLVALHDTAGLIADMAHAVCWQGRCHTRGWDERTSQRDEYNAAGRLMQWLGDEMTEVAGLAVREAALRAPLTEADREVRLTLVARGIIEDGDHEKTAALARDLADLAAEQARA